MSNAKKAYIFIEYAALGIVLTMVASVSYGSVHVITDIIKRLIQ